MPNNVDRDESKLPKWAQTRLMVVRAQVNVFSSQLAQAQARIKELKGLVREMGKAATELLSGHDQLYDAFFHYLPNRNPLNDLAAKAAREILADEMVKEILKETP